MVVVVVVVVVFVWNHATTGVFTLAIVMTSCLQVPVDTKHEKPNAVLSKKGLRQGHPPENSLSTQRGNANTN